MYETKEPNEVSLAKPNSRSKRCDVRLAFKESRPSGKCIRHIFNTLHSVLYLTCSLFYYIELLKLTALGRMGGKNKDGEGVQFFRIPKISIRFVIRIAFLNDRNIKNHSNLLWSFAPFSLCLVFQEYCGLYISVRGTLYCWKTTC